MNKISKLSATGRAIVFAIVLCGFIAAAAMVTNVFHHNASQAKAGVGSQEKGERVLDVVQTSFPGEAVRIKRINNLQSANFPEDLEVEIENVSDRPIYYIDLNIELRDSGPCAEGNRQGFDMRYGDGRLHEIRETARDEDVPIQPNKSVTLKPDGKRGMWLRELFSRTENGGVICGRRNWLFVQIVNFGDGTGYAQGSASPPNSSRISLLHKAMPSAHFNIG